MDSLVDSVSESLSSLSTFEFPLSEDDTNDFIHEVNSLSEFLVVANSNRPSFSFSSKHQQKTFVDMLKSFSYQLSVLVNTMASELQSK